MKNMRRFVLALLTLCLLGSLALAEDASVWAYDSGNYYLRCTGELSGDVTVPAGADGFAVNAIEGSAFSNQHSITSLTMPDTLRALQDGAVSWMDGLSSVTLNDGLEYIGSNFQNCNALTSVTVPAGVRIVKGAFGFCENLREIRFEGECPMFLDTDWCFTMLPEDYVLYVPDDQLDAYRSALWDVNGAADHLQPSGKNAVVPEAVNNEDWFEFDASTGAITGYKEYHAWVEIPAAIGGAAVKSVEADAFAGNYGVYAVVFPEGLERIGSGAFRFASNLAYAKFPSTLKSIGDEAFFNAQIDRIDWSEGLEEIGARAFQYDRSMILSLPATLRTIGDSAFEGSSCQELYLGGNVERIGARAFAGTQLCYMAFDLYEPIDMASDAFADTWLSDLDLPWDCSSANRDAYAAMLAEQCPNCTVWINNPESGGVAELPVNELEITGFQDGVWTMYNGDQADLTVWTDYDGINVYALGDGLFKGNQTIRSFYPHHCGWFTTIGNETFADSSVEYVELFDSITTIGDGAFRGCVNITELNLSASLASIGTGAFEGCTGITELTLPETLTSVSDGAFRGCTGITELALSDTLTAIGAGAFEGCTGITELTLPETLTSIGTGAFRGCTGITELTLPGTLTSIGDGAFEGCTGVVKLTVLCDPSVLTQELLACFPALTEIYAAPDATDDQVDALSALMGYSWYEPVPRVGETRRTLVTMPYDELPGDDFWYDEEYGRLDAYQGYELNLVLPRGIDGVQLTTIGGGMMSRASCGDNFEAELPVVSVVIPENYTEIPVGAFQDCDALETVICYAPLEKLEEGTFAGCTSLTNVIFVNGVREIDRYVFTDCLYLETIYIGDKTRSIDENAFLDSDGFEYFTAEQCITDPAQMPDVDALLEEVACEPMTPDDSGDEYEYEAITAAPIGDEGAPFFGTWKISAIEMDGMAFDAAELGMVMDLTLNSDGTCSIYDGEETGVSAWTVSGGAGWLEGGMLTIDADGRLCMDEDGTVTYFVREDGQSPASAPETAAEPAPAPETIDEPAPAAAGGAQERLDRKYVCVNADVNGYTIDAAMLGGEYALTFHSDGAADFKIAGTDIPGLSWSQGDGADTFLVDYYGTPMEVTWTETGFDLNYMDSMLMHFAAAE